MYIILLALISLIFLLTKYNLYTKRLLLQARDKTYTVKNIKSAFEATGISPCNPRRVLNTMKGKKKEEDAPKVKDYPGSLQPRTPYHGKSLASHTRHTVALFKSKSPSSSHQKLMVEKLARAAEKATAENVILWSEIERLQEQSVAVAGIVKTKSRKVLSRALLVSAEDVVRLREESDRKEEEQQAKRLRVSLRKGLSEKKKSLTTIKQKQSTQAGNLPGAKDGASQAEVVEVTSPSDGEEWEEEGGETLSQELLGTRERQPPRISRRNTRNNSPAIRILEEGFGNLSLSKSGRGLRSRK